MSNSHRLVSELQASKQPLTVGMTARMQVGSPAMTAVVSPVFNSEAEIFDIVIVGGGLSGLALAAELASPEFSQVKVLVLEQRQRYVRDRTWSYWKTSANTPHRYSHLERQCWSKWHVRQGAHNLLRTPRTVVSDGKAASYGSLDANAFYSAALQAIARSTNVELRLGTSAQQIVAGDSPRVITGEGRIIAATWVFDARPPVQNSPSGLVQQFLGYEVKTDRDVFDVTAIDLMHFYPSSSGLHFFYVLPYGPRNALVETTWISPASFKPDFEPELRQYLAALLGSAAYEVVYTEKGSLNLGSGPGDITAPNATKVLPLGRGAGTLRASTGYAFLETLAHAEHIAASLKQHISSRSLDDWTPPAFSRPALDQWMDAVFLTKLARDWSTSSGYFMQMFERVDADTLVAFLSGRASLKQRFLVAIGLPILPFLAHLASMAFSKSRQALR